MNWASIASYVELGLGFVLVLKLLFLRLHSVYRFFAVFLLADISGNLIWAVDNHLIGTPFYVDYRILWLTERLLAWTFTLLTVYALLGAILAQLPGILKLSRRVLNLSFALGGILALGTALPEYRTAAATQSLVGPMAYAISAGIVMDRVVASVALIALVCILCFLIWFPVEMSRNLIVFVGGFVVYFAIMASLLIVVSLRSNAEPNFLRAINMLTATLSSGVFAYWTLFITRAGENVPAKFRIIPLQRRQQDLMLAQLEAMNASLLRAARR